jgi:transposase-like protein
MPRDCAGTFGLQRIARVQRRAPVADATLRTMHARGVSAHDIQGRLHEVYSIDVPPPLLSTVTTRD